MASLMEFWGVEVKSGQALKINPGNNKIVHLSQASLGEVKKDGGESVHLYLNVDDKRLVLGTLSALKFPQLSFDLIIEKGFELSHNWKHGSVYFTGYKLSMDKGNDDDNFDSEEDVKEIQLVSNGQGEPWAKPAPENPNAVKPSISNAKQKMKDVKPYQKVDDSDSDDSDSSASSSDDDETSDDENPNLVNHESDSDDASSGELDESDHDKDDEDTDESDSDDEDEETPKKAEPIKKRPAVSVTRTPPPGQKPLLILKAKPIKKRPAESATKTLVPGKKAKFITPEKTEGRKGIDHIVTPHPSKKSGKTPATSDQTKQQPKNSFPCKSCNRSFTTEGGLQSHTKAKHSGTA